MSLQSAVQKGLVACKLITVHDEDVLASEKDTQELYQDAINNGKAPGNTCKIQFLGDARAGKTSLCKKLRGVQFDPHEKPTHGINTKLCQVNNVDDITWKELAGDVSCTEFDETTIWYLAKKLLTREISFESNILQTTYKTLVFEFMIFFLFNVGLLGLVIFLFGHSWSFCLLVSVAALIGVTTRRTPLYRVISCCALMLLFSKIVFDIIIDTDSEIDSRSSLMKLVLPCIILGFSCGFLNSCGLRTAIIFAIICVWLPSEPFSVSLNTMDRHKFVCVLMFQIGSSVSYYIQCRFPLLGYQVLIKLTGRSLYANVQQYVTFILLFISLLAALSIWNVPTFVFLLAIGLLCGMVIAFGMFQGRKYIVKIKSCGMFFVHVLGVCTGWLLACCCGFVFVNKDLSLPTIVGIIFRIGLLYKARVLEQSIVSLCRAPVEMVSDKLFQATSRGLEELKLQKKLSLWDFAGQELYYNTHHAFMATHAVYLLVFDLTRFTDPSKCFREYQRIHFWLQSIYTHAMAPVILVGTHADKVTLEIKEATNKILTHNLTTLTLFNHYQVVSNGKLIYFAVDNSNSILDDTPKLRKALQKSANQIKPMTMEYPIKWRRLLNYIYDIRQRVEMNLAPQRSLITTVIELQKQLQDYEISELKQVLVFLNDTGEIIYDGVDCVLRQFVLFDPQFIVDFMYYLTEMTEPDDQLSTYWTLLHSQGILHDVLVKQFLNTTDGCFVSVLLTLLEAKDLICKVQKGGSTKSNPSLYIVPSLLPTSYCSSTRQEWTKRFYIDFAQFHPHAVLSRLMARCATYSDLSHESSLMCRDGGIFSMNNQFCFKLHLHIPCPTQHLIEVAIRTVPGRNPLDLLKHLWRILETIRLRDFPRLRYSCGIICPHPSPHQGCPNGNEVHVVPLASHDSPFTDEDEISPFRLCFTRLVEMDPPQMSLNSENDASNHEEVMVASKYSSFPTEIGNKDQIPDSIDAFVSCSPRDDGWVKENIIRILSSLPHSLTIHLNKYDSSTQSNMILNAQVLKSTPVVIVICSRHYKTDPAGRLRYEREMAYRYGIKLIPIVTSDNSIPTDIYDVEPIYVGETNDGLLGCEFYEMLLREIADSAHAK